MFRYFFINKYKRDYWIRIDEEGYYWLDKRGSNKYLSNRRVFVSNVILWIIIRIIFIRRLVIEFWWRVYVFISVIKSWNYNN